MTLANSILRYDDYEKVVYTLSTLILTLIEVLQEYRSRLVPLLNTAVKKNATNLHPSGDHVQVVSHASYYAEQATYYGGLVLQPLDTLKQELRIQEPDSNPNPDPNRDPGHAGAARESGLPTGSGLPSSLSRPQVCSSG